MDFFSSALPLQKGVALVAALGVLAAVPGLSVLLVTTRTAALGLRHGLFVTAGIVCADFVFILIAVLGLAFVQQSLSGLVPVLSLFGGLYLIWLGVGIWRSNGQPGSLQPQSDATLLSSFTAGLTLTLADHKAILFYLGFFPAFVDLSQARAGDIILILLLAGLAVGGVKLAYALLAHRAARFLSPDMVSRLNGLAAMVLVMIGLFLLFRFLQFIPVAP